MRLATQTEALDEAPVAGDVGVLKIVQEATTLTDEQQQTAAAVMVVLVVFEVTREVGDAPRQQCDLYLRRSSVAFASGVLVDDFFFGRSVE
jgi:hypothetical protein